MGQSRKETMKSVMSHLSKIFIIKFLRHICLKLISTIPYQTNIFVTKSKFLPFCLLFVRLIFVHNFSQALFVFLQYFEQKQTKARQKFSFRMHFMRIMTKISFIYFSTSFLTCLKAIGQTIYHKASNKRPGTYLVF